MLSDLRELCTIYDCVVLDGNLLDSLHDTRFCYHGTLCPLQVLQHLVDSWILSLERMDLEDLNLINGLVKRLPELCPCDCST